MNNQYTYNQPPTGPLMPPPMPIRQRLNNWRNRNQSILPKWLTQYGIGVYLAALMVVSLIYSSHTLPWYYILSGVVAVLVFFLYGSKAVKDTAINHIHKAKTFEKRIFWIAFVPRIVFMLLLYALVQSNYGAVIGSEMS